MEDPGIVAYEAAVTRLLRDRKVSARWEADELWGMVAASVVVAASELAEDERLSYVEDRMEYIRNASKALTVQLIANVVWDRAPLALGVAVIGNADEGLQSFINSSAHGRIQPEDKLWRRWVDIVVKPRTAEHSAAPVAIACWTVGQNELAFGETERQLRNIVDLALLLERDLVGHKIYRRGDTNRPGIRGLVLDRGAIGHNLKKDAAIELATTQFTVTSEGGSRSVHWFSAEPLPLGALLDQDYLLEAVQSCLKDDPISSRVRVAARWFAEAHYTLADDDAALALGVAMDSLLTGKSNLPGSAMADRVAMLAEDPIDRPNLVEKYLELYQVRSSVAHGGRSSKLNDPEFIEQFRSFVHWIAWRSLALRDKFSVTSEGEMDALFNDLRWGVRSWGSLCSRGLMPSRLSCLCDLLSNRAASGARTLRVLRAGSACHRFTVTNGQAGTPPTRVSAGQRYPIRSLPSW
jgi:hypothetical protein